MKPKWKPHDDPSCQCEGCKPKWTVDETSGIAIPQNQSEWEAFCAANGLSLPSPWSTYGYEVPEDATQEEIGEVESLGWSIVAGEVTCQQHVTGWRRQHISLKDKT